MVLTKMQTRNMTETWCRSKIFASIQVLVEQKCKDSIVYLNMDELMWEQVEF